LGKWDHGNSKGNRERADDVQMVLDALATPHAFRLGRFSATKHRVSGFDHLG
jgi:hypothetical protein